MTVFRRSLQRYGRTPEPDTPYQRAGQLWDERIGSARLQARNWRLIAFGNCLLSVGLAAALIWQAHQSRITPYVVAVDKVGQPAAITPVTADFRPDAPEIAWQLVRFISDVRTISLDPVVMRQNWLEAYGFASVRGAQFLTAAERAIDPFGDVGERTVSVEATSVVRISERSFQVKWTESHFDHGAPAAVEHWTAILTFVEQPPATVDTLRRNPLGLFIDAIDWSRELEPSGRGVGAVQAARPPAAFSSPAPETMP